MKQSGLQQAEGAFAAQQCPARANPLQACGVLPPQLLLLSHFACNEESFTAEGATLHAVRSGNAMD